jgi:hypothetical protein
MGARTTWQLKQNGQTLSLYSHWGGETKLIDTKRALLSAKPRWFDDTYAMRIFISQIIGEDWHTLTGYGLGMGYEFEEEFTPCEIDFDKQTVTWGGLPLTFAEFVEGRD